jgi:hypothetical protein
MIPMLLAALLSVTAPAAHASAAGAGLPGDSTLRALYAQGRTFEEFVAGARRRTETWRRMAAEASADPGLVSRARSVGGAWHVLAIAEDFCGDSAFNLPYVAKLVAAVPGLELRIVGAGAGRSVMEAHRTPDGRAATPTFLLLDSSWKEVGCFVERPAPLVAWHMENRATKSSDEVHAHVQEWYDTDKGRGTVTEFVEILEAAAAGRPRCVVGAS